MSKLPKNYKKSTPWRYATGRIRALEMGLMGREGQDRMFMAPDEDALSHVLVEYGYQQGEIEPALEAEKVRLDRILSEVAPDERYRELLLSFTDGQNLKTLLKEKLAAEHPRTFAELSYLMLKPAQVDPEHLSRAVQEDDFRRLPEWIPVLAREAEAAYTASYDAARIDLTIDKGLHQRALEQVSELKNAWLTEWLILRRDLINLETLLRSRLRNLGAKLFADSLLPAGELSHSWLKKALDMGSGELKWHLIRSSYRSLAGFVEEYGNPGVSSAYSSAGDELLMQHIHEGGKSLNGPEITLAYLFGREMEMKNIRIALSALRNRLPEARVKTLRRSSYPDWR
ncbi:MAG: V-type ATPase subunit [Clostridiaceae bacterium]|jgi:V/A-type H+-transporting ATPase subunit C|nr:V-type ATPase subunit [Clostridiaceae bacterium]